MTTETEKKKRVFTPTELARKAAVKKRGQALELRMKASALDKEADALEAEYNALVGKPAATAPAVTPAVIPNGTSAAQPTA